MRHRSHASQAVAFESEAWEVMVVCAIDLHSCINIRSISHNLEQPMDTITDLLKVECVCSRHSGATCVFVAAGA